MSDLVERKLDYIDDKTILIIDGYIRNAEKSLTSSLLNHIPIEIFSLTLCYIDDHFMMYRGSFQWRIKDPQLLQNILTSQQDQTFTSDVFEIAKLPWIMKLCPNGNTHVSSPAGQFNLYVEILSMPPSWTHILVCQTMKIEENNVKCCYIQKYKAYEYWGWPMDTISLIDIKNLNPQSLTFTLNMKILRIVSKNNVLKYQSHVNHYRKHYTFEWKIGKHDSYTRIFSLIIGEIFCAFYVPSRSECVLQLCGLPNEKQVGKYVDAIQVKWTLNIIEADMTFSRVGKLGYDEFTDIHSKILIPSFNRDDYKQYEEFTFKIEVEILNEYDLFGNIIGVNIEDAWNKFIDSQNSQTCIAKNINDHDAGNNTLNVLKTRSQTRKGIESMLRSQLMIDDQREMFRLWLSNDVKLGQYYDILVQNGFDNLSAMGTMNIHQLEEIGIDKIGHRQQLMRYVKKLNHIHISLSTNTLYLLILQLITSLFVCFIAIRYFDKLLD